MVFLPRTPAQCRVRESNSDFRKPVCSAATTKGLSWTSQWSSKHVSSSGLRNRSRSLCSRAKRSLLTGFSVALPQAIAML